MNGHNETLEELSHAWLRIVAARNGAQYQQCDRRFDASGIDAAVLSGHRFYYFQLKATAGRLILRPEGIPFRLRVEEYDRLRADHEGTVLLVVLFFPDDPNVWTIEGGEGLLIQARGFWMNLRGAAPSVNEVYQTVYLPPTQELTSASMQILLGHHK